MNQESAAATAVPSLRRQASFFVHQTAEFSQEEKTFIPIGEKKHIFVVPDIFRKEVRVNIREYFAKEEKKVEENNSDTSSGSDTESKVVSRFIPTKRGVSLTLAEFENLCEKLERTKTLVKRLGKRLTKKQH